MIFSRSLENHMNRVLFVAFLLGTVSAPLFAQQSTVSSEKTFSRPESPVIERTETIHYEKKVTEKRLDYSVNSSPTTQPAAENLTPPSIVEPVYESQSSANVSRNGQPVLNQLVFPGVTGASDQSEIRALRILIEAQNRKIDSIQHQMSQPNGMTTTAQTSATSSTLHKAIKRDNISIGIYAGPNVSKYSSDQDSLDSKARVGYQLGVYVRGGGRLFGQLGVEYVGVSSKLYSKDDKGSTLNQISSTINTHYVQIPLQIGFRPAMTQSKRTGIRIQAGAELSYLLDADKNDFKLTDRDYNKTVVNLLGGIGFDLGLVTLDVSYHYGIKDVYKEENAKLRMVSASLGFKF